VSLIPTAAQRLQSDRLKFPGLLPEETLILRAWLALHQTEYDAFDYNVRLGTGDDPGPGYSDAIRRDAILNSQLRVDALAWKFGGAQPFPNGVPLPPEVFAVVPGAQAAIIECKRRAATAAVSQLSTYFHLWLSQFPANPQPTLILVANTVSATILPALTRMNIHLYTVQVDFSILRPIKTG
jgi:hypothetical protein